jgi:hypothetical protein
MRYRYRRRRPHVGAWRAVGAVIVTLASVYALAHGCTLDTAYDPATGTHHAAQQ